jgi:hypothetical protein
MEAWFSLVNSRIILNGNKPFNFTPIALGWTIFGEKRLRLRF